MVRVHAVQSVIILIQAKAPEAPLAGQGMIAIRKDVMALA